MTDQELLSWIQALMIEPRDGGATWPSGLWTASEVLGLVNEAQNEFLKLTGIVLTAPAVPQGLAAGVQRVPVPSDLVIMDSVAFNDGVGRITDVARADEYQADQAFTSPLQSWEVNPIPNQRPLSYTLGASPSLQLQVMPVAGVSGVLHYLYVALATTLTGLGVSFTVADEFVPPCMWRVIEKMLSKIGRGAADERAQYAGARWDLGVAAARVMNDGWV